MEKGYPGRIRYLGTSGDGDLISVSGGVPAIVRAWDLASGHILNAWPVAEQNPERYVLEYTARWIQFRVLNLDKYQDKNALNYVL